MKIYRNISKLTDYETYSKAGDVIDRLKYLGLEDEALSFIESVFPDGCSEDEFENILTSDGVESFLGFDFMHFDSKEDEDEEYNDADSWREVCVWDDMR